jgi:hypothetical protein
MKKLLFSAVALVAFSSVSMGNTLNLESNKLIVALSPACDAIAYDTYHTWYGNGFSDEVARAKAKTAKTECLAEEKKKSVSTEPGN